MHRYLHLDVFTDQPLTGNQLAVFPNAEGLSTDTMQAIALEMAFSETTFVLPPENSQTDFRVRIFTPRRELPMAGHPTIGTTFALAHERRIQAGRADIRLGLGVGPTPVSLEWAAGRLHFAWMTQPLPEFGRPLTDFAGMAAVLGIREEEIRDTKLPIQIVSCGLPFLFVPLVWRESVDNATFDQHAFSRFCSAAGIAETGAFIFSLQPSSDDAAVYSRMFAPAFGVYEDPATGGASGPLGSYLVHHRAVTAEKASHMVSLQGVKMGRPSRIHISISTHNDAISRVRVGGQSVLVAEGALM